MDAAVDGDEVAFGDHETGFVIDVLRETCNECCERITTLGNVWIGLDVVACVEALTADTSRRWKSEVMASSTSALLR